MTNQAYESKFLNLAVLISGGGRTMQNLQQEILAGRLSARIGLAISSREDVAGVGRARDMGLPLLVLERRRLGDDGFQKELTHAVAESRADLVCMAGFLSLWHVPAEFLGRVINIHPALLPEFGGRGMYGHHVHEAVLRAGKSESGCTVHFCDNEYDRGPIILQRRVPVLAGDTPDTLAERVFVEECMAYPDAIRRIAEGRVTWRDGQLHLG